MKANLNWFGQNTKTAIVIENTIAGFSIGRIEIDSPSNQLDLFPNLQFQNTKNHFEDFTSYQRLASHLELLYKNGELQNQLVIFGCKSDPFLANHAELDESLKVLKLLLHFQARHCVIQTRSTHVLLALPILRQNKSYFTVNIGLETISESTSEILTPELPSPSQRLTTVKAIKAIGIATCVSIFPISTRPQRTEDITQITKLLSRIGTPWQLLEQTKHNCENDLEIDFPLYDWQMAKLLKQLTRQVESGLQHLSDSRDSTRQAA